MEEEVGQKENAVKSPQNLKQSHDEKFFNHEGIKVE